MNSLVFDLNSVLLKDIIHLLVVLLTSQVLSAGQESIALGHWCHTSRRSLVNALNGEGLVHVLDEVDVAEEALWVISLILLGDSLELIVGQSKVHLTQDGFELRAGHTALSQLIKVTEEFLDTDSLHDDGSLKAILDIRWVVRNIDVSLGESVAHNINSIRRISEESAHLLWSNANLLESFGLWSLSLVLGEHILWSVDVLAEVEVVDLLSVSTVAVTASDQVENLLAGRHDVQVFHDAKELLGRDVLRLGTVEVLEAWLEEHSVADDVPVQCSHHLDHHVLLLVREHLFKFETARSRFASQNNPVSQNL